MRYSILIGLILNRYVVIVACVIAFILMSTFPGWHEESGGSGSDIEVKPVSGHVGAGSMALGWISVAIIGLVGTAILTMILSISMLRKLTDDSE
jgi:hypothetical protein